MGVFLGGNRSSIGGCCLNCEERFPACHDVCSKYLQAKAEWQERQDKIREAKQEAKNYNNYHYDQVTKLKRYLSHKKGGNKWKNK